MRPGGLISKEKKVQVWDATKLIAAQKLDKKKINNKYFKLLNNK
jgi:hypothetical protein